MPKSNYCACCGHKFAPGKKRVPGLAVHVSRGLCTKCDAWFREQDAIHHWPRLTTNYQDLLEEWRVLKADGFTKYRAAQILGVSYEAFLIGIKRAELKAS
jgi:hypothetical protein